MISQHISDDLKKLFPNYIINSKIKQIRVTLPDLTILPDYYILLTDKNYDQVHVRIKNDNILEVYSRPVNLNISMKIETKVGFYYTSFSWPELKPTDHYLTFKSHEDCDIPRWFFDNHDIVIVRIDANNHKMNKIYGISTSRRNNNPYDILRKKFNTDYASVYYEIDDLKKPIAALVNDVF